MPPVLTYPGVYIQEIPSGVRTITGVGTSVAGFVGTAKRGPIDTPTHILSFADFERGFGGLAVNSEMSYAVRQFFLNGGGDCWVVRVAANVVTATAALSDGAQTVLDVAAIDGGLAGNNIRLAVDYQTANPASTFNLTVSYQDPANPSDTLAERFQNLSMNPSDTRFVEAAVNKVSKLITVSAVGGLTYTTPATSTSGALGTVAALMDATHNQFQVAINGLAPIAVQLTMADVSSTLAHLAAKIQQAVLAGNPDPIVQQFTCVANGTSLVLSEPAGISSSVRVLPGTRNDVSGLLKLGTLNGGVEVDSASAHRPLPVPVAGTYRTGAVAIVAPTATKNSLLISVDGNGPDPIAFNTGTPFADVAALASQLQALVRAKRPAAPGYKNFTAVDSGGDLLLTSGSTGAGSGVVVFAAEVNDIAAPLNLLAGATAAPAMNLNLVNGHDELYNAGNLYSTFVPNTPRKGIFALDTVDGINLLCLPGVTDPSTLIDTATYCKSRGAFLIADAPSGLKPNDMATYSRGTGLPKTDCGAVYYPWIDIGDPLNAGKLRPTPPSGTIAGLYARTDSTRGVWKAPAGTEATLTGAQGVEYALTDAENGILNPLGVNCIRLLPVFGVVNWGARTLNGSDAASSEYKYVPVRRLALYLEGSLYQGTKWVVFEPNDEPLWGQIRLNIGAFMQTLFRQGAFQGKTPREAYFVKCDKETTTQNDINQGIVNIVVGFAPLKPAEFVVLQIQQIAGQIAA